MTAKDYLQQAYLLNAQINSKLEQVQTLNDLATKASVTLTPAPASGMRDVHGMEDFIAKMVDMKDGINKALNRLLHLKQEIATTIGKVESAEQRVLLELRYLCEMTWEEISYEMNYCIRSVYTLHGSALKAVDKVLGKK